MEKEQEKKCSNCKHISRLEEYKNWVNVPMACDITHGIIVQPSNTYCKSHEKAWG